MRIVSALSIGLLCSAFALPANAEVCPSGSQWVPPGYVAKGAWQIGHCSAWSGGPPICCTDPAGFGVEWRVDSVDTAPLPCRMSPTGNDAKQHHSANG